MGSVDYMLTPTVQRVLAATLTRPEQSFTLADLLRIAGTGRGSAQLQIDRLVDAGVLREEPRRGRQRSLQANKAYFLYPELRSIALKSFGLTEPLREALLPHAAQIAEAFVFGSVAKGTDVAASDIDVIVVGSVSPMDLFEPASELTHRLGREVRITVYETSEWQELVAHDPVVSQIAQGPRMKLLPHE